MGNVFIRAAHQKEVNPAERETLMAMIELIVQDRTVSQSPPS